MSKSTILRAMALLAAMTIAACGGGGGGTDAAGDDTPPPATPPASQAPFNGAAVAIPGTLEAENFDLGGQGVAYHDSDAGNSGGRYRMDEDVDIVDSSDADGGDYDVNRFGDGEWLSYAIDVAEAGDYLLELRVAGAEANASLNVQLDGADLTGDIAVPATGSAYSWLGRANVALSAGSHTLTVQSGHGALRLNRVRIARMPESGPYLGAPHAVPGTFNAEDFDLGGEGAAYHDLSVGNVGGAYRNAEDVDIAATTDPEGGGYDVMDFSAGEWVTYSIDVARAGDYVIALRTAADAAGATFSVMLDGQALAGPLAVAGDGAYAWVTSGNVSLPAGEHELTVGVGDSTLRVNSLRIEPAEAAPAPPPPDDPARAPYRGSPAAVPGTFEAEDFDKGGQGLAYHDAVAGNTGGAYRADEDVDIAQTADSEGGQYEIVNFETGEWLTWSIDVARDGVYDIELRASSAFPDSGFHIEIDDHDVTGPVAVPNTGDWNAYQWVAARDVSLAAGTHVLRVVADRQYFNLNRLRISDEAPEPPPPPSPPPSGDATLLFSSGFEGGVELLPLVDCWGTGCWQDIVGVDVVSSFNWPGTIGAGGGRFLMLSDPATTTPLTMGDYMFNRIENATGPRGGSTKVLYQEISRNANGTEPMGTSPAQNEFQFLPQTEVDEMYVSFWVKLQPDLVEKMRDLPAGPGIDNGGTWRAFFALKTGSQKPDGGPANDGDYRIETYIMTYGNTQPYWVVLGDNNAGGGAPRVNSFNVENRQVPVPVGEWFKFEIYWKRSNGSDGRVWMAVDGQVLADRAGPNMGAWDMPINRIMAPMLYSGSRMPVYQWIDDVEVWDGFPPAGDNPPYGAH